MIPFFLLCFEYYAGHLAWITSFNPQNQIGSRLAMAAFSSVTLAVFLCIYAFSQSTPACTVCVYMHVYILIWGTLRLWQSRCITFCGWTNELKHLFGALGVSKAWQSPEPEIKPLYPRPPRLSKANSWAMTSPNRSGHTSVVHRADALKACAVWACVCTQQMHHKHLLPSQE